MAKKFLNDIDMDQNEILNMRVQNLSSAPSNPKEGQIYYDSTTKRVYKYNGTKWEALSEVVLIQFALINLEAGCDPQDIYNAFTNSENATKADAEAVLAKIQAGTPTFIIKDNVNMVIPVTTYIMASRRIIINFILRTTLYYFTIFTNIITKSDWSLPTNNKRVYELVPEDGLDSDSATTALSANQGRILNEKITSLTTYSTAEIKTGETWIDGKPLYRKTFNITSGFSTRLNIPHNISNIDYCKCYGTLITGSISAEQFYASSTDYFRCFRDGDIVKIRYGTDNKPTTIIINLEYTKTTD